MMVGDLEYNKKFMDKVDMMLCTPMNTISIDDITQLKKSFGSQLKADIITANNLKQIVDGSQHVQIATEITSGNYYVIFIDNNDTQKAYDNYIRWIRGLHQEDIPSASNSKTTFIVSKRGHLLKLST